MQRRFLLLFFCLLCATGFSQEPIDWSSPIEMGLNGPVRSLDEYTWEAVRDSSGQLVKKPGVERRRDLDEHYTWSPEGKTLTAAYDVAGLFRIKDVYEYSNGRLIAIDGYQNPGGYILDSTERKRWRDHYPDSVVPDSRTTYQYDRHNRLSKETDKDTLGDTWSEVHYYYRHGRLYKTVETAGSTTHYRYDKAGHLVAEEKAGFGIYENTRYTYENGRLVTETTEERMQDTLINCRTHTYDVNGLAVSYCRQELNRTTGQLEVTYTRTFVYNEHGKPIHEMSVSDGVESEVIRTYAYDNQGNWVRRTEIDGAELSITERTIVYY